MGNYPIINGVTMYRQAVVNAANPYLSTGSGITGALVRSVGGDDMWNSLVENARFPINPFRATTEPSRCTRLQAPDEVQFGICIA